MRYFIDISYKGTHYHGWQIQPNGITVQEEIEHALSLMLKEKVGILGSGRTDTGVHAKQQIAHFDSNILFEPNDLIYKLNSYLSKDISINALAPVKDEAHARFDAERRTYYYHIHQSKDPFLQESSYYFNQKIDVQIIGEACEIIKEWKNFECFSKVHTEVNNFECEIFDASWHQTDTNHLFQITANRFLRGMVRAVVGTLLDVGTQKTSLDEFRDILSSNDRSRAGRAVPAQGLFLEQVTYPKAIYK